MNEGYIPTEFEVMKLLILIEDCDAKTEIGNKEGIIKSLKEYVIGREYERKQLWANLTAVIGFNMWYRKDSYFISKEDNETFVDLVMAKKFIKENKNNWGNEYISPYKKRTPLESALEVIRGYSEGFKDIIAEEYIKRMNEL